MEHKKIIHRLRRVQGQIDALVESIDKQTDCDIVVPQFLAAQGAVGAALITYLEQSITLCADKDPEQLKNLISTLIKQ
ncbi:MAG: metal-sensing transcriptional repressor [Candidatus Paceibacteria bacterium]